MAVTAENVSNFLKSELLERSRPEIKIDPLAVQYLTNMINLALEKIQSGSAAGKTDVSVFSDFCSHVAGFADDEAGLLEKKTEVIDTYLVARILRAMARTRPYIDQTQIPPGPLSDPEADPGPHPPEGVFPLSLAQVVKDVQATLPGYTFREPFFEVLTNTLNYLLNLFSEKMPSGGEEVEAWLQQIPVTQNPRLPIRERFYQAVLGVILGGVLLQQNKEVGYESLVHAIMQNPYFDLTPYLRITADQLE